MTEVVRIMIKGNAPVIHGGSEQISQRHAARDLRWLSDQIPPWFASLDEANDVVEDPLIADLDV